MILSKKTLVLVALFGFIVHLGMLLGCGSSQNSASSGSIATLTLPNGGTLTSLSGDNVLPLSVSGSLCASGSYANKPCVSVTVCAPGSTSNCQTLSDILVDTGSYGFRVFKSALNASLVSALSPITATGGQSLANCTQYGDGSSDWGPVERVDLVLGNESAVTVPIQVIDATFANSSAYCGTSDVSSTAGYTGILGIGLSVHDCGTACVSQASNLMYYACSGSTSSATCTGTTVPLVNQLQNPVALLSSDNNGTIIELPSVGAGGQASANGYLVLGIGTRSNNTPSVKVITLTVDDSSQEFTTVLSGQSLDAFLDSGSNGYFFPPPSTSQLPDCISANSGLTGWFCPSSVITLSTTDSGTGSGSSSSTQVSISFQIGNMNSLANTSYSVFSDIGANLSGNSSFDWGLPFYLGRNVYTGIEGKQSSLGTGPYWAF